MTVRWNTPPIRPPQDRLNAKNLLAPTSSLAVARTCPCCERSLHIRHDEEMNTLRPSVETLWRQASVYSALYRMEASTIVGVQNFKASPQLLQYARKLHSLPSKASTEGHHAFPDHFVPPQYPSSISSLLKYIAFLSQRRQQCVPDRALTTSHCGGVPPSSFLSSRVPHAYTWTQEVAAALCAAGFDPSSVRTEQLPLAFQLSDKHELFEAFLRGTGRTRAVLEAQSTAQLGAIRDHMADALERDFKTTRGTYEVPAIAVVHSAATATL
eukprot:6212889-Pleurochrysis_carterae.AAC.6